MLSWKFLRPITLVLTPMFLVNIICNIIKRYNYTHHLHLICQKLIYSVFEFYHYIRVVLTESACFFDEQY